MKFVTLVGKYKRLSKLGIEMINHHNKMAGKHYTGIHQANTDITEQWIRIQEFEKLSEQVSNQIENKNSLNVFWSEH